jgi:hypothetical protein
VGRVFPYFISLSFFVDNLREYSGFVFRYNCFLVFILSNLSLIIISLIIFALMGDRTRQYKRLTKLPIDIEEEGVELLDLFPQTSTSTTSVSMEQRPEGSKASTKSSSPDVIKTFFGNFNYVFISC